ncbi:sugar transferase, partial [Clostridium tyrobutyricum]
MKAEDIKIDSDKDIGGKKVQFIIKRIVDFILALIGLIILSPVFLIITFWIKKDSKGPVIFKQERVGKDGLYFTIYKFRTMIVDAEKKRKLNIDA